MRTAADRLGANQGGRVVMGGAGMVVTAHGIGVQAHRVISVDERFPLCGELHTEIRPPELGSCVKFSQNNYLWLDDRDGASRINTASRGERNNLKLMVTNEIKLHWIGSIKMTCDRMRSDSQVDRTRNTATLKALRNIEPGAHFFSSDITIFFLKKILVGSYSAQRIFLPLTEHVTVLLIAATSAWQCQ